MRKVDKSELGREMKKNVRNIMPDYATQFPPDSIPVIDGGWLWSAVAQLVECRTRNRESPGSNPRCYRFEVWAFSFTSRRLSRLSCINEYLAIDSGGHVSE